MKYKINEKIFNKDFGHPFIVLSYNEKDNLYTCCYEKDLSETVEDRQVYLMDEKKLDLIGNGYLYARGEILKLSGFYDDCNSIFARSVGGSGFRIDFKRDSYRLLSSDEILDYKHKDFRQKVLNYVGIELDEPLYREKDVVKFFHLDNEYIGEIKDFTEDFLFVGVGEFIYPIERNQVIHWYPNEDLFSMVGNEYYKCI